MSKRHSEQFKQEAVAYALSNKDKPVKGIATSLGIGYSTLDNSMRRANGTVRRELSGDQQRSRLLNNRVSQCFAKHGARAGAPCLTKDVNALGLPVSQRTVGRALARLGLRTRAVRKFKATTNSKHKLPVDANVLNRQFTLSKPNQVWVSDITYIRTDEGGLYLAIMLDLFSRQLVGWQMSRKGNCWDNAVAESFFASLKKQSIYGTRLTTREQARQVVFEYIEHYYNRVRRHSNNGWLTPVEFERLHHQSLEEPCVY